MSTLSFLSVLTFHSGGTSSHAKTLSPVSAQRLCLLPCVWKGWDTEPGHPSQYPLCLSSSPGLGGTKVIKNTAPSSVRPACVAGLLWLWRCSLDFHPIKWFEIKNKIRYRHVCQLSTNPSVFTDKTRLAPRPVNFHKAWTVFDWCSKKGNAIELATVSFEIR